MAALHYGPAYLASSAYKLESFIRLEYPPSPSQWRWLETRDAPDSGLYYPAGYRISRIVKNYPAGLFGRIVVM